MLQDEVVLSGVSPGLGDMQIVFGAAAIPGTYVPGYLDSAPSRLDGPGPRIHIQLRWVPRSSFAWAGTDVHPSQTRP